RKQVHKRRNRAAARAEPSEPELPWSLILRVVAAVGLVVVIGVLTQRGEIEFFQNRIYFIEPVCVQFEEIRQAVVIERQLDGAGEAVVDLHLTESLFIVPLFIEWDFGAFEFFEGTVE